MKRTAPQEPAEKKPKMANSSSQGALLLKKQLTGMTKHMRKFQLKNFDADLAAHIIVFYRSLFCWMPLCC
jgi:hypothetical protein